jgi:hypothetical protein
MMNPSLAGDATLEHRVRIERMALALAFEANAVTELACAGSARTKRVRAAARMLERDVNALAPALDAGDPVMTLARLVLRLLPQELEGR